MTDTIRRVARPRGVLSEEQLARVNLLQYRYNTTQAEYRVYVVSLLASGCSFNEVSKATGLSKDTLQRWKREAGK